MNGGGVALGVSRPDSDLSYVYGRAGAVLRIGGLADLSLAGEVGRERLATATFDEVLSNTNPFEGHFSAGRDRLLVGKLSAAFSRHLASRLGFSLSAGYARLLDRDSSVLVSVPGIGSLPVAGRDDASWLEYRGSIDWRIVPRATIGMFVSGIAGEDSQVGSEVHGGVALVVNF